MDDRYILTDLGRAYLDGMKEGRKQIMCKPTKHNFIVAFADRVDQTGAVLLVCSKCGESIERSMNEEPYFHAPIVTGEKPVEN